jgi:hypothetical protein
MTDLKALKEKLSLYQHAKNKQIITQLIDIIEVQRDALDKHLEYAQECRGDWSEYDGRAHLCIAEGINYEVSLKTDKMLGELSNG